MHAIALGNTMGNKKADDSAQGSSAKSSGTMIRVSREFADHFRLVCALLDINSTDLVDQLFLPQIKDVHRKAIADENRRLNG